MASEPVRVGVLSFHTSKESKAICNAIEALGHHPEWVREANTVIHMHEGRVDLEPDVDVVANRLLLSNTEQPSEELGIANAIAALRPMVNSPRTTAIAAHKIATAALLVENDVPVPETLLALNGDRLNRERGRFAPEAVYKTAIGTHGGGAWKVPTTDPLSPTVGNRRAFLQKLIGRTDEEIRDLRVYVVDGSIVGAMYRYAPASDWRTNVAQGGSVTDATDALDQAAEHMALDAVAAVGLDYAGVDLIEGDDGWYVLEVNPTAGFKGLYSATGISPAPYIAKVAIERVGGTVDREAVRTLAATLDDSTPSCMPSSEPTSVAEPVVIGLTERVVVHGTTGTKTVVGKSDSGADRTSIDLQLAADIGAGPIHTVKRVRSGGRRGQVSRPIVDLVLGIGGRQHTVEANVEDRGHMSYPLLLGRDVLKHYHLDVTRRVEDADVRRTDEE
ncbi:MAG: RimK/LysX family protein [Halobacteriota archaeon]